MAKQSTQMRLIVIVGGVVFFGVMLYSTFQQTQKEYEVCVTFEIALIAPRQKDRQPKKPFTARRTLTAA